MEHNYFFTFFTIFGSQVRIKNIGVYKIVNGLDFARFDTKLRLRFQPEAVGYGCDNIAFLDGIACYVGHGRVRADNGNIGAVKGGDAFNILAGYVTGQ